MGEGVTAEYGGGSRDLGRHRPFETKPTKRALGKRAESFLKARGGFMVLHPCSGGLLRKEGRTWCKICEPP